MSDKLPRTDSTQAMKSIFSAYGDDEEKEDKVQFEVEKEEEKKQSDGMEFIEDNISGSEDEGSTTHSVTPVKVDKRPLESYQASPLTILPEPKKLKSGRKATRLVSYGPEEEEEEDEEEEEEEEDADGEKEEGVNEEEEDNVEARVSESEQHNDLGAVDNTESHGEAYSPAQQSTEIADDVQLPPEPPGKCSKHLQDKIRRHYERNVDLVHSIKAKKDLRNPSIYEKLLEFCEIDEKGTNYPPELYNTSMWSATSFYDELAKEQKIEMDKREKEKKDRTKVEFVTGMKKTSSEGEIRRKTKWDTAPSGSSHKPSVISAVGTIKKSK